MRRLALLVLPTIWLVLTACGDASSSPAKARTLPMSGGAVACCPALSDARVTGVLVGIGGPSGAGVLHWAGTVHVRGRAFSTVPTDGRGHFSMRLPAGRYWFTGTSPSYDGGDAPCRLTHPIRFRSHRTAHVRVICQMK